MDQMTKLSPEQYGLKPTNQEIYLALAVRSYLIALGPEKRKRVLSNLLLPGMQQTDEKTNIVYADRQHLGLMADYTMHETLKTFQRVDAPSAISLGTAETSAEISHRAVDTLKNSYNAFCTENMSKPLEAFLRALWEAAWCESPAES